MPTASLKTLAPHTTRTPEDGGRASTVSDPGVLKTPFQHQTNDSPVNNVDGTLARRRCYTRLYLKLRGAGELLLAERARADLPLFLCRLYV